MIRDWRARLAAAVGGALGLALLVPSAVAAHTVNATYASRLPLAVYVVGAATTVALSFAFVIVRDVRAAPPVLEGSGTLPPAPIRSVLRVAGLVGWSWIIAQGIAGGSSDGDVATLFLWVYGWVGLAIVSAVIGPAWHFLDPFSTLHDLGAWFLARFGIHGWDPAAYPAALGRWPATIAFAGFVWVELVFQAGAVDAVRDPRRLHRVHARDDGPVRARRVAVAGRDLHGLVPAPRSAGRVSPGRRERAGPAADVRERAAGAGLECRRRGARRPRRVVDHLRRPVADAAVLRPVRRPGLVGKTILLLAFLGIVVALAFAVSTTVGMGAIGAGLLPIALGYLDRALPDVPADRWAADRHRHLGPVPAGAGTSSGPRSTRRPGRGCHPGSCGPSSWRPWSVGTCSAPGAVMSWRQRMLRRA